MHQILRIFGRKPRAESTDVDMLPGTKILPNHQLKFYRGGSTLIVSFEGAAGPRQQGDADRLPWGYKFYTGEGHSLLGVNAYSPDWYRCPVLIAELRRLSDGGFFSGFEKTILTGSSMGGFAAAAFAPLVPGCTVITFMPQSTLDSKRAPWEGEHPQGKKLDWSLPFSDGAEGVESAGQVYLFYDNFEHRDVQHADRLARGQNVMRLILPGSGHGVPVVLAQARILKEVNRAAIAGKLDEPMFRRLARARKKSVFYRKTLVKIAMAQGHYQKAIRVCDLSTRLFSREEFADLRNEAVARLPASQGVRPVTVARTGWTVEGASDTEKPDVAMSIPPRTQRKTMQDAPTHRFDRKFPNLKGCLFIVTYGRTGSTLLQGLVSTLPGCVLRGENHNVMETLWGSAMRARLTRNTWGKEEQPLSHPWHGADRIRPAMFGGALVDAFVDHVLCPPRDVQWLGFKEIRYNALGDRFPEALDFMRFHFKNAHFIFNTRRKEDVAKSAWWANWKYDDVVALIDGMDRRFSEYHSAHPEFTTMTSYESFSTDTQALAPLFEKLGETLDEAKIKAILGQKLTH